MAPMSRRIERPCCTLRVAVGGIVVALWLLATAVLVVAEATAIYGVIIDGTGRDPIADGVVVVREDRIIDVGPVLEVDVPQDAREIRIPKATVLPGLIDTHVHKAYDARTLSNWAASGVTTVRDLGADPQMDWDAVRDAFALDPTLATLILSGPLVTVPDGYGVTHGFPVAVTVSTPAEAQATTRSLIASGVDIIKIAIDSSMPLEFDAVMPLEIAAAIVEAAHELDTSVVAHISNESDVLVALDAGVDQIAHTGSGTRKIATIQRLADQDVIWVTTLFGRTGSPYVGNFYSKGGLVAMGTDQGAMGRVDTDLPVEQLQRMMRSGMDAMSVIVASTRNGAIACGIDDEVGTLETGKYADILVVSGDPLEDITVLGDAAYVMHHGAVVRNEGAAD
jgi:imidazolonepropionase-like amidohydrolase